VTNMQMGSEKERMMGISLGYTYIYKYDSVYIYIYYTNDIV
jgi:hypothetical protein